MLMALIALALPALPAAAQPALVVPPGSEVVVPPRGAAVVSRPRPVLPPAGGAPQTQTTASQPAPEVLSGAPLGGGLGLAAPALLALPLAALGALAAGSLPGGGSGTTAPARTR
jgi:hypothetical protein